MNESFDYVVIGSGPAGHASAIIAAQSGLKTAVIEKDNSMFGGVCLNEGCIPAKSLFHDAGVLAIIRKNPGLYGAQLSGEVKVGEFVKKSRRASENLQKGLQFLFKKNGIMLITGFARVVDKNRVEVSSPSGEKSQITGKNILIATGSRPRELDGMPFDGRAVIDSSAAMRLEKVPKSILIVGAGAIGVEFASYFNILGSKVTLVEIMDSILSGMDRETSRRVATIFKQDGINVLTSASLADVRKSGNFDVILVSAGRVPNTQGLGLENADIQIDKGGFIDVDDHMRTSSKNIFAAGDCLRTPMLAHTAYAEGELAAKAAAGFEAGTIDYDAVPNVVYTRVHAASVGMSEEKAKTAGFDVAIGKQFFKSNGRAVVNSETEGFIKVVADIKYGKLLGAHIVGHEAAELIHEFAVAKRAGLTADDIAKTIHAHPTFSETAQDAARAVFGKLLHG